MAPNFYTISIFLNLWGKKKSPTVNWQINHEASMYESTSMELHKDIFTHATVLLTVHWYLLNASNRKGKMCNALYLEGLFKPQKDTVNKSCMYLCQLQNAGGRSLEFSVW